jgi:hypothetical protein
MKGVWWKKPLLHKGVMIFILIFICNSIYKYREISLSPAEIKVRQVELCNELGFPKTALHILKKGNSKYYNFTKTQEKRLEAAEKLAKRRIH